MCMRACVCMCAGRAAFPVGNSASKSLSSFYPWTCHPLIRVSSYGKLSKTECGREPMRGLRVSTLGGAQTGPNKASLCSLCPRHGPTAPPLTPATPHPQCVASSFGEHLRNPLGCARCRGECRHNTIKAVFTLILSTSQGPGTLSCYPHFTDRETGSEESGNLPVLPA